MERSGADALTAVLAGAAVYVQLMPSLADVRRAGSSTATARDVRSGLIMGSAALVGVGLIISVAEREWRPLWLCGAAAALLGGIYEATLRQQGEAAGAGSLPSAAPAAGRYAS